MVVNDTAPLGTDDASQRNEQVARLHRNHAEEQQSENSEESERRCCDKESLEWIFHDLPQSLIAR